ncbi:MAG: Peptidoglycan/LPS O-acetylase OafA/YrhL, contains acyltransferase and SGNH-hydrolase domain [Bacteroidota bacterium]|nr:Peptidoglycan/LPS O-acetylase OafA/YrhL, contains acyltransferase and SGNH-hydrolase domain [Bacteroidota bacterium]
MIEKKNTRLRELDFLRGIAILLVLFRHQKLIDFTSKIGWIGVDLFFVLSGFLVSGLLFQEYMKFGNIKPKLFLIRRAFKIYPIYFLFYFLYITPKIIKHQFEWKGLFSDFFFIQNYVYGWGYAYVPSWSLAVEEHFYFGFVLLLWLVIKSDSFNFKNNFKVFNVSKFEILLISIMVLPLIMRLISSVYFTENGSRNITMTHLRIDSLLAGVLISYLYYFKRDKLTSFFAINKIKLLVLSLLLISFTPFIDFEESIFVRTFGFTFVYVAFGILILHFLTDISINNQLNTFLSKPIVDCISKIGFSSYSIYIIHGFINWFFALINTFVLNGIISQTFTFIITSIISVLSGMFMTFYIENYFLKMRNKYYPSRID